MTIQARQSEWDPRLYNINRDLAHNFGQVVTEVAARLEDGRWPIVVDLLKQRRIKDVEVGEACAALCRLVATPPQPSSGLTKDEAMLKSMLDSGWFSTPEIAQLVVMAVLGTVITGYHWAGVREATVAGTGPVMTYGDLAACGARCSQWLTMSRWQRRWLMFKQRCQRVWKAIRGV